MKSLYTYIALTISMSACGQMPQNPVVNHQGILREIMMEQNLQANASLSDFKDIPNLYALGALEGLSGEVLIINSRPSHGTVNNGSLSIDKSFERKATLLVSSEVADWSEKSIHLKVANLQEVQSAIAQAAIEAGIDTKSAFPFLLKGSFNSVEWHVINAKDATEQTHEAYKKAGLKGASENVAGEILGFYSEQHEGVFTHHGSFLHMHFIDQAETEMGHVDNLKINGSIQLLLPKINKK